MSVFKKILIVTALVVGLVFFLAAILIFLYPPCSNVRECYAVWRGIAGGETDLTRMREGYVQQFAASKTLLVFAVPNAEGDAALIVFDRSNRTTRRIGENGSSLYAPFLSQDQKRLVFARHRKNSPTRDVLSCDVERWQCRTMASVEDTVFSPVEPPDTVVFASSPPRVFDGRVRYVRYDVVLAQAGLSQPITQICHALSSLIARFYSTNCSPTATSSNRGMWKRTLLRRSLRSATSVCKIHRLSL